MIAAGHRWELQSAALSDCKRVPGSRTVVQHLGVVWANYQDAFGSVSEFLIHVRDKAPAYECGKFAAKILAVYRESNIRFTSDMVFTCL